MLLVDGGVEGDWVRPDVGVKMVAVFDLVSTFGYFDDANLVAVRSEDDSLAATVDHGAPGRREHRTLLQVGAHRGEHRLDVIFGGWSSAVDVRADAGNKNLSFALHAQTLTLMARSG